jgi:predicted DNA-binding transcriptional regulator AlpA
MSVEQHQFGAIPMNRQPQPRPALLTLDQVAKMLGTSKAWVRDHATRRNPRIPCVRLGGRRALLRFRPQDIDTFIEKHLICTEEYA